MEDRQALLRPRYKESMTGLILTVIICTAAILAMMLGLGYEIRDEFKALRATMREIAEDTAREYFDKD